MTPSRPSPPPIGSSATSLPPSPTSQPAQDKGKQVASTSKKRKRAPESKQELLKVQPSSMMKDSRRRILRDYPYFVDKETSCLNNFLGD